MDVGELLRSVALATARLGALLRAIQKPHEQAVGHWTTWDVAVHLSERFSTYPAVVHGKGELAPSIEEMAAFNEQHVRAGKEADFDTIAAQIERDATAFVDEMRASDPEEKVPWISDILVPPYSFGGIVLSEILIHGFDIARGEGTKWPIDPADVGLTFEALIPLIPHYLDREAARGLEACYDLRLRGGPRRFFAVSDDRLEIVEPDSRRVDCRISADPVAFLLVSYGRSDPLRAALTGKILAWGRKPWLGLKMPALLRNP